MRTESFEGLVGRALIGDPRERDIAECRIVCKSAAMNGITCKCGDVLDQKTTVLFERDRAPFKVVCHRCAEKLANALKAPEFKGESKYAAFTWNGTVPGESYVSPVLERERKKTAKSEANQAALEKRLPRAKSFQQIITPKDASNYAVAKSQQLYDAHGIVTDGVIIMNLGSEPSRRVYKRRDVDPVDPQKIGWFREQCEGYLSRPSSSQVMTIGRTDERVEQYHCCRFNPLNDNAAPSVLVDVEYVKTAQNLLGKLYWTYSENNPTLIQGVNKKNAVVCAIALIRQN
jgi:hypothetical protein